MKFTKMHGIGNDYIYFNGFDYDIKDPGKLSVKLSDRHKSVGGDGVVLILPSDKADFRMRMFNADGSEGKMCGNASRCIGKYVFDKGLTDKTTVTLETLSGIKTLYLHLKDGKVDTVTVNMGKASFRKEDVPFVYGKDEIIGEDLEFAGTVKRCTAVSMGNPHNVIFGEAPEKLNLAEIGPVFENAHYFPERVNTEFVRVINPVTLEMRVWERGSGETMACGTGACAVASSAVRNGISPAGTPITVKLLGGNLTITVSENFEVMMEGEARIAFEGENEDED
ncbi:MAG: diaminopimelate epimerase [Clostridia bacterium]|nr:diaminopimelate epimerase [Clostridia bacterium]